MMTSLSSAQATQSRIAQYYCHRLQQANAAIRRGPGNREHWLRMIQEDWEQIKEQQAWAASGQAKDFEQMRLSVAFATATTDIMRAKLTPSEQLIWVQQALAAAQRLDDTEAEHAVLYQLGIAYLNLELLDQADLSATQLMEQAQITLDEFNLGRARYLLGASSLLRGLYDTAESYFKDSIDILLKNHAEDEIARVWRGLGRIALYRGDYEESYDYHIRYLDIAADSGNHRELGASYIALCGILIMLQDYGKAEDYATRALNIAHDNGFRRMVPAALLSLAGAEKEQGKFDDAFAHYSKGIDVAQSISPPSTIAAGLYGLGQIFFLQGNIEEALIYYDKALKLARDGRFLFRICDIAHDLVCLYLTSNDMDNALTSLYELTNSARELGTPHFMAKALAAAIIVWQHKGQLQQAAIWARLLTNYNQYLTPRLFSRTIYEQLKSNLDPDDYHQAPEQDNPLTLEAAIEAILNTL